MEKTGRFRAQAILNRNVSSEVMALFLKWTQYEAGHSDQPSATVDV
jgi:hypothetical protein